MSPTPNVIQSALLIDDDPVALTLYSRLLRRQTGLKVITVRDPAEGLALARRHLFDLICLDVTIDFAGSPFGGFELYKLLLNRYGKSSLIVYSQYVTTSYLRDYRYDVGGIDKHPDALDFNFVERHPDPAIFVKALVHRMTELRRKQSCFVAMPLSSDHRQLFEVIQHAVRSSGYVCLRSDLRHFTKSIIEQVLHDIRQSKLIVFVATDRNANAFYECGYAMALDKEIITLTDSFDNLPFDIRDRAAIAYRGVPKRCTVALRRRIRGLTVGPR